MKRLLAMVVAAAAAFAGVGCGNPTEASKSLWDFKTLEGVTPDVEEAGYTYAGNDNIRGVFFEGASYRGNPTRIFAYLGIPKTEKPESGYPAMVLVHGGLGRAFPDWVKLWNDRGYAAIAISVDSNITDSTNDNSKVTSNPDGGPNISVLPTDLQDPENSWEYISVANVIRANNILRSIPEVDDSKIGITGISWGSYLTCITVGVDDRFAFGMPVYGAGFMDEDVSGDLKAGSFNYEGEELKTYRERFDPSAYMKNSKIPLMWFAGANDAAFAIDCTQRCADLNRGENTFSWRANLRHGQQPGDGTGLPEIFLFADAMTGKINPLVKISNGKAENGTITADVANASSIKSAKLFWSSYPLEIWHDSGNFWSESPVTVEDGKLTASIPEGAVFAFVETTDKDGNVISSRCFGF